MKFGNARRTKMDYRVNEEAPYEMTAMQKAWKILRAVKKGTRVVAISPPAVRTAIGGTERNELSVYRVSTEISRRLKRDTVLRYRSNHHSVRIYMSNESKSRADFSAVQNCGKTAPAVNRKINSDIG